MLRMSVLALLSFLWQRHNSWHNVYINTLWVGRLHFLLCPPGIQLNFQLIFIFVGIFTVIIPKFFTKGKMRKLWSFLQNMCMIIVRIMGNLLGSHFFVGSHLSLSRKSSHGNLRTFLLLSWRFSDMILKEQIILDCVFLFRFAGSSYLPPQR